MIALDLLPLDPLAGVDFIQGDFREEAVLKKLQDLLQGKPVGLGISNMAPNKQPSITSPMFLNASW